MYAGCGTPGNTFGHSSDESHGHGRGGFVDWRNNPDRQSKDNDLTDPASSPIKATDVVMTEAESLKQEHCALLQLLIC